MSNRLAIYLETLINGISGQELISQTPTFIIDIIFKLNKNHNKNAIIIINNSTK